MGWWHHGPEVGCRPGEEEEGSRGCAQDLSDDPSDTPSENRCRKKKEKLPAMLMTVKT